MDLIIPIAAVALLSSKGGGSGGSAPDRRKQIADALWNAGVQEGLAVSRPDQFALNVQRTGQAPGQIAAFLRSWWTEHQMDPRTEANRAVALAILDALARGESYAAGAERAAKEHGVNEYLESGAKYAAIGGAIGAAAGGAGAPIGAAIGGAVGLLAKAWEDYRD